MCRSISLTRKDVLDLGAMNRQDTTSLLTKPLVKKELSADQITTAKLLKKIAERADMLTTTTCP